MCPCQPLDSDVFDSGPPPFGFTVGSVPFPDLSIPFPDLPLEYLEELFRLLGMILPSGLTKPTFHPDVLNDIMSGIMTLLNTFMPFLMLYKFFLPVLNLILCIIEVLCSIPNPFKVIRALRRLFRVCIPEFLAMFPFFALILMIIALILLIIALIEYIIARLLQIIETIIRNILLLYKAASAMNSDSIMAIVKKIGDLLCVLQNIFILFAVFNSIFQIIKAMAGLSFKIPPCDSADGSDDGCCTPDVCPEFLRENETIVKSTGTFKYLNKIGIDSGLTLPLGFPQIFSELRAESWQFYDPNLIRSQEFINITNAWDLPLEAAGTVFFPPGANYNKYTGYKGVPYYITFKVLYKPLEFIGREGDPLGERYLRIVNAIIEKPPIEGVYQCDGSILTEPNNSNGTLFLIGGVVSEDEDDAPPILNGDGSVATVGDFFHNPTTPSAVLPDIAFDDAIYYDNIEYIFTINHPVLMGAGLITAGCVPSLALERDALAATVGQAFNQKGIDLQTIISHLPDMDKALQDINGLIADYRKKISIDTTNQFKEGILSVLDGVRTQSAAALVAAISAGYDPYNSDFSTETIIQFTTEPIKISVAMNDSSGNSITTNLPTDIAATVASGLSAVVTFGETGQFTYDGSLYFNANITSPEAGNGAIQVAYDNNFIGILTNPADLNEPISLSIKTLTYTFVKSQMLHDGSPRRDDTDISGGV